MPSIASTNVAPQTFIMFQNMPFELRLLVWTWALPGPRRIDPFSPSEKTSRTKGTHQNPILLYVNHESRSVALQHYQTWRCMAPELRHQYIDFKLDIIVLDHHDFVPNTCGPARTKLSGRDFYSIEMLELRFRQSTNTAWDDRYVAVPLSHWISKWLFGPLAGIKQLHVLMVVDHVNHAFRKCELDTKLKSFTDTAQARGEEAMVKVAALKVKQGVSWTAPSLSVRGLEMLEVPGRWNSICMF